MPENLLSVFIQNCNQNKELAKLFEPEASSEELQIFKLKLGCELPHLFYQLYGQFNGTIKSKAGVFGDNNLVLSDNTTCILSLEQIIQEKKVRDEFVDDMATSFDANQSFKGWNLYWFWNKGFVPFQATTYDLLVIDTVGVKTHQ